MSRWIIAAIIVAVATGVDAYAWKHKEDSRRKWWRVAAWFLVAGAIFALYWAG